MYTKEHLVGKIKNKNHADSEKIATCLKIWRIDPIYEDEENNEYYDDLAVHKLNHGIKLKELGRDTDEIVSIVNNGFSPAASVPVVKHTQIQTKPNQPDLDLNKVTLDITAQTLALLADSIAQKISGEISEKIKESNVFEPMADSVKVKRDNEILAKQIERILEENKKLISRNNFLQGENAKFKHLFGTWYTRER